MMKLSSQSDGMTPFLTMSLARSATNLAPVSPDAFSISATIPEGPAALPVFILVIAFTTISTSIWEGQQQGQQSGPQDSKKTLHSEAAHSVVSKQLSWPCCQKRGYPSHLWHICHQPHLGCLFSIVLQFWRCRPSQVLGLKTSSLQRSSLQCKLFISHFVWPVGIVLCHHPASTLSNTVFFQQ